MDPSTTPRKISPAQKKAQDKILKGLAELHAIGVNNPPKLFLALCCGYTNTGSHSFSYAISYLKDQGLITVQGQRLTLTNQGLDSVKKVNPPKSNEELHNRILRVFSDNVEKFPKIEKATRIFRELADGKSRSKKEVADACGYTCHWSGPLCTFFATFNKFDLIVSSGSEVRLADSLFPYGLPKASQSSAKTPAKQNKSNVPDSNSKPMAQTTSECAAPSVVKVRNRENEDKTSNTTSLKRLRQSNEHNDIADGKPPATITTSRNPLPPASAACNNALQRKVTAESSQDVASPSTTAGDEEDPILIDSDNEELPTPRNKFVQKKLVKREPIGTATASPKIKADEIVDLMEDTIPQANIKVEGGIVDLMDIDSTEGETAIEAHIKVESNITAETSSQKVKKEVKADSMVEIIEQKTSAESTDRLVGAETLHKQMRQEAKATGADSTVQDGTAKIAQTIVKIRRKILMGLEEMSVFGIRSVLLASAALFAEIEDPEDTNFVKAICGLEEDGVIKQNNEKGTLSITDVGIWSCPTVKPRENAEFHVRLGKLVQTESKVLAKDRTRVESMFQFLCDGLLHTEVSVAQRGNCKCLNDSVFRNFIKTLSEMGLLDKSSQGLMQLSGVAFPTGRPDLAVKCTCMLCIINAEEDDNCD